MTINRTHLAGLELALAEIPVYGESADRIRALIAKAQAAPEAESVEIEAVATTKENADGELYLDWLLEGGISALEFPGQLLLIAHDSVTDDTGQGQIYTAPQHDAELIEILDAMRSFTLEHDSGIAGVLRGKIDAKLATLRHV